MRIVELRRHAERGANEDLTPEGRAQCARARATLDLPYDAYYVSPKKRARETMEAFGIADPTVDERLVPRPRPSLAPFDARHEALMADGADAVTAWFAIPEAVPFLEEHGRNTLLGVLDLAARLSDRGRALAVSHGGTIEPFAVVALGRPYGEVFGTAELGYCEGVRAHVDGDRVVRIDVVRLVR